MIYEEFRKFIILYQIGIFTFIMKLHFNFIGEVFTEDHLNLDDIIGEALKMEGVNNKIQKGNQITDGRRKQQRPGKDNSRPN